MHRRSTIMHQARRAYVLNQPATSGSRVTGACICPSPNRPKPTPHFSSDRNRRIWNIATSIPNAPRRIEHRVCHSANPPTTHRTQIGRRYVSDAIEKNRPKSTLPRPRQSPHNDRRLSASRQLPCPLGPLSLIRDLNHTTRANRPWSARSDHTAGGSTAFTLKTSGICRPLKVPHGRKPSRSFRPHTREIGEVTARSNLQHRDRLPYALPAASYTVLRDSVPRSALLGSNSGGLPRAAPCSAGVDTADGLPVCVHLLVSVVDAPVRPC